MFVNFDKTFKQKPSSTTKIPETMISYLNNSLPHGIKYIDDNDGTCSIISNEGVARIGGVSFIPTDKYKHTLGKDYTPEDILNYSYNSQQPIPLAPNKNGFITINGKELPVEKIKYDPFKPPIKYVSGILEAVPPKFPPPFEIEIGSDKYKRKLSVSRVPNDSLNIVTFESKSEQPLTIKYFLNETTQEMTMTISYNLKYAKTIRDMVESISIYNAYAKGKGYLCGSPLNSKFNLPSQSTFDDKAAKLWEKVLKIEEYLEVSFLPPQKDTDYDTICKVEQLYQNLINKIPTRDDQKIDFISGEWNMKSQESINSAIGIPIFFELSSTSTFDLFGVKFELPCIVCVFNSVLSDYKKKRDKYTLFLSDESEQKPMFTSIMCFKSKESVIKYKMMQTKLIETFRKAENPSKYLR